MALVHDLIEVYAGDTFAYDKKGNEDKEEREKKAADKLFGMLPEDQGKEIRDLWEEFDQMETPDAQYAASIDRLQPLINNYMTQGHTWHIGTVTSKDVYARAAIIEKSSPRALESGSVYYQGFYPKKAGSKNSFFVLNKFMQKAAEDCGF